MNEKSLNRTCGACWVFSAIGAIEGANKIKAGNLTVLSEQQILSCARSAGSCDGGWPEAVFQYMIKNKGVTSAKLYPYLGRVGVCRKFQLVASISSFTSVKPNDELALLSGVNNAPVSVAVDASLWQNYKSGIFAGPCGKNLNHAVSCIFFVELFMFFRFYWLDMAAKVYWIIGLSKIAGHLSGVKRYFFIHVVYFIFFS